MRENNCVKVFVDIYDFPVNKEQLFDFTKVNMDSFLNYIILIVT